MRSAVLLLAAAALLAWPAGAGPRADKVFKPDDRYRVAAPTDWPWRATGRVFCSYPDGSWASGTAAMVGPRHALTAGHIVYDRQAGGYPSWLEVAPGYTFGDVPFGAAEAVGYEVFDAWIDTYDPAYDVALIVLDDPIGDATGWLDFAAIDDAYLLAHEVTTAGYPGDRDSSESMWATAGFIEEFSARELFFAGTFDVWFGQSGSALWVSGPGGNETVAGAIAWSSNRTNGGPRIDREKAAFLKSWIDGTPAPGNLAVPKVGSDLPPEVEAGAAAAVTVTVENRGGLAVASTVALVFVDAAGQETPLGDAPVSLPGGTSKAIDFGVLVPAGAAGGPGAFQAVVDPAGAADQWPRDDDAGASAAFVVLPAWRDIALGERAVRDLAPFGVARFRFVVPPTTAALRLKLSLKAGRADVRRPGGSTFTMSKRWWEASPPAGLWEVVVRGASGRAASAKFSAK